jgi:sugar transferase EpsL
MRPEVVLVCSGEGELPGLLSAWLADAPNRVRLQLESRAEHSARLGPTTVTQWLCQRLANDGPLELSARGAQAESPLKEGSEVPPAAVACSQSQDLGHRLQQLLSRRRQSGLPLVIKRSFDVTVASTLLLLAAPLAAATAAAVAVNLGRPVLFRQQRPGKEGRPFHIAKFRTMSAQKDATGNLLPDALRLGRLGKLLRSLSLDEVPQLLNVLRGEMSLVGPRPLLMQYLPLYSPRQSRRHEVLPGITGWAAVNGRNDTTWERRLAADVWYAEHWSLRLDLEILVRTAWVVLARRGVSKQGHATMPEFSGSDATGAAL